MGRKVMLGNDVRDTGDKMALLGCITFQMRWSLTHGIAIIAALLLASAGGSALGWRALWAFDFLRHIPWPLRMLMALLVLAPLLIRIPYSVIHIPYSAPLLALGAGLIFWIFRERTYHGDALYKLQLLSEQRLQTDPYVWKEPLDSILAYGATALAGWWGWPPEVAIAGLSVIAGVVYVAAVLYVVNLLGEEEGQRVCYLIGLLALGSAQLWFGHIENYSLVTAASFGTVALALGYLRGRNPLWPVGLAAGLAISLHPQALFTVPALAFLLDRQRWLRQMLTLAATGLVVPLFTLVLMASLRVPWPNLAGGFAGDSQLFLTPAQILSLAHLWDVANNLWLVAPLAPILLVIGFGALRRGALWRQAEFRYLTALAAGLLVYLLAFQNDLPRPQDWDLFAIVGPGFTLWGFYCWEVWLAQRNDRAALTSFMVAPMLLFALFFTASWVGVNYHFTLIHPSGDQRDIYARYRILDLTTLLPQATVTPPEPICVGPSGCERVAVTSFTLPQTGDSRPVFFAHAPARITLPLALPGEATFLWLSPMLAPESWGWGGDGVTFQVAVEANGSETMLWSRHITPDEFANRGWQEIMIPLGAYRNQHVNLILYTNPGPANNNDADRAGWGLPWLMRGTPQ
jgi:hypothetical protein